MPDDEAPFMAVALDDACGAIQLAWRAGERPTSIALAPTLYAQLCAARRGELERGEPLLLLDLAVVEDAALRGSEVVVR